MSATAPRPAENRLLAALPEAEYAAVAARCTVVALAVRAPLYEADAPIAYVDFPLSGMASVTTLMADGGMVEVGTIGREGTTGLPVFFGGDSTPLAAFVQVPGDFARLPVADFRAAAVPGTALHQLLLRYAEAYLVLTAQSAGCNRLHPHVERCARWLLLTHDRVGDDTFPLSHEFLGMMLGTRRSSVTLAMGAMQEAGLLTYHRGVVTILDRTGLEDAACECYAIIRRAFTVLPSPA